MVFRINIDGTGYTNLDSLNGTGGGVGPLAGLVSWSNTLFGTTCYGGVSSNGAVFAVNSDGTGFTTLHDFSPFTNLIHLYAKNSDGASPECTLARSGNTLFGTTSAGGAFGSGAIFQINTDGTGFTNIHSFSARISVYWKTDYNLEGSAPMAGLILSGDTLYGTTSSGGTGWGEGTVFKVNTDGSAFSRLHSFDLQNGSGPSASLALSGNVLYGTTRGGGGPDNGIVFAINTDGTGFTNLHTFSSLSAWTYTNSDGANPAGGLVICGDTLYGVAYNGGAAGVGTIFKLNTNGTGFCTLHSFGTAPNDGRIPAGELVLSGNMLYGTTEEGGQWGQGSVFSLLLLPQLKIVASPGNLVLTWPTNAAGFTLESTTNLLSAGAWTRETAMPAVVNGDNVLTDSVSVAQKYYRLRR